MNRSAALLPVVLSLLLVPAACGGGGGADGSGAAGDGVGARDAWYGWDAWSPPADTPGPGEPDAAGADDRATGHELDEGEDIAAGADTPPPADVPSPADAPAATDGDGDGTGADVAPPPGPLAATLQAPERWQRGPVTLRHRLSGGAPPYAITVSASLDNGATWFAATDLTGHGDPLDGLAAGDHRFVWDSFADAREDDTARVRLTVTDAAGDEVTVTAGPFILRDAPDRPRVALVTSAINGNNKVRRLDWRHGAGFAYDGNVHEVGARPVAVVFEPGGRAAAVLQEEARAITWFAFGDDGAVTDTVTLATPSFLPGSGVYAGDAAALYVAGYDSSEGAGVYRVATDPWTGLPVPGVAPEPFHERKVVSDLALLPDGRGMLVFGGTMGDPLGALRLDVLGPDGAVDDHVYFGVDGTLPRGVGVSPDGRRAIAAGYNVFGDGDSLTLVAIGDDGTLELLDEIAASDPDHVAFHSSSLAALVSEAEGDAIFPVRVTPEAMLAPGERIGLPIPVTITSPTIGADRDRFFVTTVWEASSIAVFRLTAEGIAAEEASFPIGTGTDVIPAGLGIQP